MAQGSGAHWTFDIKIIPKISLRSQVMHNNLFHKEFSMKRKLGFWCVHFSSESSGRVRRGGRETWNLCGHLRQPSFLWFIFTEPAGWGGGVWGAWPPRPPGSATSATAFLTLKPGNWVELLFRPGSFWSSSASITNGWYPFVSVIQLWTFSISIHEISNKEGCI